MLEKAGFSALAIEFRTEDTGDQGCAMDVVAAVRYLHRNGASNVSVIGGSFGGAAAAQSSIDRARLRQEDGSCGCASPVRSQRPPATSMNAPVTYEASAESSHRIAAATSSGCPPRCIGTIDFTRSTPAGSPPFACNSV